MEDGAIMSFSVTGLVSKISSLVGRPSAPLCFRNGNFMILSFPVVRVRAALQGSILPLLLRCGTRSTAALRVLLNSREPREDPFFSTPKPQTPFFAKAGF